ncbi:hypothetical protein J6590_081904 [Homalodisca vitripennis]|nr:hypothetical protein J6590_081904 [Homalodisca vitripennis]
MQFPAKQPAKSKSVSVFLGEEFVMKYNGAQYYRVYGKEDQSSSKIAAATYLGFTLTLHITLDWVVIQIESVDRAVRWQKEIVTETNPVCPLKMITLTYLIGTCCSV